MADELRTEEEQVEALKRWWDENGKSTIAVIVVALAASFGWQSWQKGAEEKAEAASVIYQNMLEAINVTAEAAPAAEQSATIRHLAETLKEDFAATTYAQFAALHLAKVAVNQQDLATAEEELRWVLNSDPAEDLRLVTQLRLARVMAASGSPDAALTLIRGENAASYGAAYAETEGDLHEQLGNPTAALEAYQRASVMQLESGAPSASLELKLQAQRLALAQDVVSVEPAASEG